MQKQKHYLTAKRRLELKKKKAMVLIISVLIGVGAIGIAYIGVITPIQAEMYAIDLKTPRNAVLSATDGKEMTIKEKIWSILDKTDLTFDEKIKAMSVIQCESRFGQYSIGINKEGLGLDIGLWQINEKFHKKRVEEKYGKPFREVAFDIELATDYALTLFYENNRSFKLWVCN